MRLLLEPQAKYRPTSHKPSRPYLPRDSKKKRLILQVISNPPSQPIENKQPPSSPPFGSSSKSKSTTSISHSSTKKMADQEDQPPPPNTIPTPTPLTEATPHNLIANLNTEASRLEIGLLALGILLLVAQMGALIWIGVRRRRKSAQWHHAETQVQISQQGGSRFSSTAGLLFRSPFSGSDAAGVPAPAFLSMSKGVGGDGGNGGRGESLWGFWRGKLGGYWGRGGGKKVGEGESVAGGHCLFGEVFPGAGSEGEGSDLGGEGGSAGHHHGLVLGPPTVIPVVSSSSSSVPVAAAASGLMEVFRRRSSAIWAESIVPPVQVQMDVLTEIGRRVSSGLQAAGAGAVLGGGGKGDGGYKIRTDEDGGGYGYADEELSDSQSMTPPEERYHKDLEVGMGSLSLAGGVTAATSSDANDNRRFSLMSGLVSIPGGGLVRRTGMHVGKRVSFVEGLVATSRGGGSGSGGTLLGKRRRHSSFVFDRRGEEEDGVGEGDAEDGEGEEALEYGYEERGREVV